MTSYVDTSHARDAQLRGVSGPADGEPALDEAPHLSIVVPVYRSERTLPELHRRLAEALRPITDRYEILFIEDCGGDRSWEVIERLCREDPRVRGVQLSRNFGQHAATICGIVRANGEWILTLDDDLEHPPEYISALVDKAAEGFDLVYAVYPERTHTGWRNFTSALGRWMFRIAIPNLNYEYSSYRLIRRNTAKALAEFDSPFPFVDGYLAWVTNRYGDRKSVV